MSAAKNTSDDRKKGAEGAARRTCFVVAPIGGDGTDTRRRSDQVLRHIIDPVLAELDFDSAVRADRITDGGLITRQVIDHLFEADLVIADLTDHNPNVFYELALRHAFQKPFVQLVVGKSHAQLPFDVAEQRTIFFDHTDLDDVERAKTTLRDYVTATMEPGADVESPVSRSMELLSLKGSSNPEDRGQANIIEMVEDLRSLMLRERHREPVTDSASDIHALRTFVERVAARGLVSLSDLRSLETGVTSHAHDMWARATTENVMLNLGKEQTSKGVGAAMASESERDAALRRARARRAREATMNRLAASEAADSTGA